MAEAQCAPHVDRSFFEDPDAVIRPLVEVGAADESWQPDNDTHLDTLTVSRHPAVTIGYRLVTGERNTRNRLPVNMTRISFVTLADGKAAVLGPETEPTSKDLSAAVLATAGLTNKAIGLLLGVEKDTVDNYIGDAIERYDAGSRNGFARRLMELNIMRREVELDGFILPERQLWIVDLLSQGFKKPEIADIMNSTPDGINSALKDITYRTGINLQPRITLAYMLGPQSPVFHNPKFFHGQATDSSLS